MTADLLTAKRHGTSWGLFYVLFFLSGISGLMYEVVWARMLTRVLGCTVYATATVLVVFMAGLALGSLAGGWRADRWRRPLVWYGVLEFGTGLTALLASVLPGRLIPLYRVVEDWSGGSRSWLTAGQVLVAVAVLLPSTTLMGATLPALCAFGARGQGDFSAGVGKLYGVNALGATVGVLASGFVLIGSIGETNTILVAVAVNALVGSLAILWVGRVESGQGLPALAGDDTKPGTPLAGERPGDGALYPAHVRRVVLCCFGVSGLAALAGEVVWGRMLLLYQGTSVYAFSSLLAVVLAGLGAGSMFGGRWGRRWADPLTALAYVQLGVGVAGLISLHLFGLGGDARPDLASGRNLGVVLIAPILFLGPAALLNGMSFPLAARCFSLAAGQAGRRVAALYFANTVGSVIGALAGGFVLIPLLGSVKSGAFLAGLSLAVGLLLLRVRPRGLCRSRWLAGGLTLASCLLLGFLGNPFERLLGRQMEKVYPDGLVVYRRVEEAAGSTTAFGSVAADPRAKQLWVDGQGMTALVTETKLMAHLPIWLAEEPRDVLVICFGMGTTVRSASRHDGIRVTAVELVPGVTECFGFFHPDGPELLRQADVHLVVGDGRNYLLARPQQVDVITIDPPPPLYSAGAVNLYSREFFALCRQRTRPTGMVCLWVPPGNRSEIRAILRTFCEAFEHVTVWEGPAQRPAPGGVYLIGCRQEMRGLAEKVSRGFGDAQVVADLTEWGTECDSAEKVLGLYIADERGLRGFVAGAPVITDDRPLTEFPLWRALSREGEYLEELNAPRLRELLPGRAESCIGWPGCFKDEAGRGVPRSLGFRVPLALPLA